MSGGGTAGGPRPGDRVYRSVESYIDDLMLALTVGRRAKRRIAEEAAGHLTELVGREQAAGLTPQAAARRATLRFGAPDALAAEFNRDAAEYGARRAMWLLAVSVGAAFAVVAGALRGWGPERPWPGRFEYYAVTELLTQVASVCVLNAVLLLVVAPYARRVPVTDAGIRLAVRSLVAAAAAMLPVAVLAAGNLGDGIGWAEGLATACTSVAVPASVLLVRGAERAARGVPEEGAEPALDVLATTVLALAGRYPWAEAAAARVVAGWSRAVVVAPRLMCWFELRRHPWRTAVTVSVAAGIALKAGDLVLKGEVDAIAAGIEGGAVFVAYALLGGLLGLRERRVVV